MLNKKLGKKYRLKVNTLPSWEIIMLIRIGMNIKSLESILAIFQLCLYKIGIQKYPHTS